MSVVPRCGRIGCQLIADRTHRHDDWAAGDRVVVEPKANTAPGWAWTSPAATVTGGDSLIAEIVTDDGVTRYINARYLTRWHTWAKRPQRAPGPRACIR